MTFRSQTHERGTFLPQISFVDAIAWYVGILGADTATRSQEALELLNVPAVVAKNEMPQNEDSQVLR